MGWTEREEYPAVFIIDGSKRHEIITVDVGQGLSGLKHTIETVAGSSPNSAEFLSKYKSKGIKDTASQIKVTWSREGRPAEFPKETVLTEENCQAVLQLMSVKPGKDLFNVKVESKKVGGGLDDN